MSETLDLGPIPPPEVGSVNHFSVELVWEEALKEANARGKGNGVIKVCLQQKDEGMGRNHSWNNCYKGMAKRVTISTLSPLSTYCFRYAFEQKGQRTEWSPEVTVTTAREPLYAENLHMAIKKQDLNELEAVLKSGDVSPDVQNEDGFTALMAAAKKPFLEAIDLLIEYGAEVDYKNHAGKTALMVACTADQLDSVRTLRQHNANYYIYDNGGCTAIHWAVDARSVKLLDWMAKDNADFNVKDHGNGGWTPLIRCANLHGDREVALSLMLNGADHNATDNNGSTALHFSVMRKHYDLTQVLLQRRADPLLPNKESTTPWQIATSTDDRRRIAQLMEPYVEEIKKERKRLAVRNVQTGVPAANTNLNSTSNAASSHTVISPVQ